MGGANGRGSASLRVSEWVGLMGGAHLVVSEWVELGASVAIFSCLKNQHCFSR